jgi:hypothetical protein
MTIFHKHLIGQRKETTHDPSFSYIFPMAKTKVTKFEPEVNKNAGNTL